MIEDLSLRDDPQAIAVIDGHGELTRAELVRRAEAIAERLRTDVAPTERVGMVDTRDAHAFVNLVACFSADRSVALLGTHPAGAEVDELAARASCAVVLDGPAYVVPAAPPSGGSPTDAGLTPTDAGFTPSDSPEAVVLFTSGTTGRPKGVRLSRSGVLSNLTAMLRTTAPWTPDDRLGQILTMSHSFGLSMALMALARRTPIVLLPDGPPSRALAEAMDRDRVTVFACVPYLLRLMSRRGMSVGSTVAPSLRQLYLAGGGLRDEEITELLPAFGGDLYLMYGFTETTARAAVRRYGDGAPSGSVGLPLPGTHVDIVDEAGSVLAPGREGVIRAVSPSLMIGYLGEAVRDRGAPFTTSDLGRLDAAGHLFITGREVEMMNFRGNRVSVVRVEAQAMRVDGVLDARAVPESRDEDALCVVKVVLTGDADLGHVRRDIIRTVEPRGIVRTVEAVERLPTTRSGKALRYQP